MPNLQEIKNLAQSAPDNIRRDYLKQLHEKTGNDTILYASNFTALSGQAFQLPPPFISIYNNDIQSFMSVLHGLKGKKENKQLDLILHSPGGSINAADQIVQYLRRKYDHIRVIVPQNAMSAATMIACAANEILMGNASALGPIDPQINGIAAQSILDEFEKAKKEIKDDPEKIPIWVPRISQWGPGLLAECSKALDLSKERVAYWLRSYMFSGREDADEKAESIAEFLSDADTHKTHGRPLGIETLREQGLKIKAMEDEQELQEKLLSVFHAATATFEVTNCVKIIENHIGKGVLTQVSLPKP